MREGGAAVESLRESFEVHVGGVHVVINIVEGFACNVAVGDHYGGDACFPGGVTDVDDVLCPDCRFVVGEGDGGTAVADRQSDDVFRRDVRRPDLIGFRFRDVPILAKKTAHVATRCAE